jgi:RNA polymerase sigma factor (sigma-70 family)
VSSFLQLGVSPFRQPLDSRDDVFPTTTPEQDVDMLLIARLAEGDEASLTRLYERHSQAIFSYLIQLTGDRSESEEILQDTFVAAWKAARRFRGLSRVRTWLLAIARRQARDRRRRHALDIDTGTELEGMVDPSDGPDTIVLARVESAEFAGLVARLSAHQRDILNLAFVQELSYAEMAEVLGVPIGTVKSRLNNARRTLFQLIEKHREGDR